jgi:hypothetical protein
MNRKEIRIFLNCGPLTVFLSFCGSHTGFEFDIYDVN